jgi:hypothetical protein
MNSLRAGGRLGSGVVINEPGNARFQELSLPPKGLSRPQGNHVKNPINDWQSLIKRSAA